MNDRSGSKRRPRRVAMKKYPGVFVRETRRGRCFDIKYRTADGRVVWEKVGGEWEGYSAKLASMVRAERIRAVRHGEELPAQRRKIPTVQEAWEGYLQWLKTNRRRRTWAEAEIVYRTRIAPLFATKRVNEIAPLDVERLKKRMADAGLAPQTIKNTLSLLRRIIYYTIKEAKTFAGPNPLANVTMPKTNNERQRYLSVEEARLLLDRLALEAPDAHDLVLLALHTGARRGELAGLTWGDVDFSHGTVTFRQTKTGKGRSIPLTEAALAMLRARRGDARPTDYVFPGPRGGKLKDTPWAVRRIMDELFNRDLPRNDRLRRVVFHTLRHTAASWMVSEGVPLALVGEILGHKTPGMTKRYSHLIPEAQRAAVAVLNGKVKKGAEVIPLRKEGRK